jgi:hypothetical protein
VAAQELVATQMAGMSGKGSVISAIPGMACCAFKAARVSFGMDGF